MTDNEIKRYVDEQIKEALKPRIPASPIPPDSDLTSRLEKVEDQLAAVIVSLRELPAGKGFQETFAKAYKAIRNLREQDARAGIDDLVSRIDNSGLQIVGTCCP